VIVIDVYVIIINNVFGLMKLTFMITDDELCLVMVMSMNSL